MNDYVDFIVKCYFKFARQRDENFKKIMISTFFWPKTVKIYHIVPFHVFFGTFRKWPKWPMTPQEVTKGTISTFRKWAKWPMTPQKMMISTFFRPKNRQNLPYSSSTFSCFFRYLSKMTQMTHDPPGGHERYHKYLSKMAPRTHPPPRYLIAYVPFRKVLTPPRINRKVSAVAT